MTRRRVRPEELELWRKVTARAEKLDMGYLVGQVSEESESPSHPPVAKAKRTFEILPKPTAAATAPLNDIAPSVQDSVRNAPLQMDRKAFGKLKRGKLVPEARIDLHGMTLDRAHPALSRFILNAQAQGKRLVLVITGKGKHRDDNGPIPVRHGVLRHQVPQWLSMPPLSGVVLQVSAAHIKHGGGGAYYVYLRKCR